MEWQEPYNGGKGEPPGTGQADEVMGLVTVVFICFYFLSDIGSKMIS